jgi:hypothetical protein
MAELTLASAGPPSTVAFQAILKPSKVSAAEGPVVAASASPVVKQTVPDTNGHKPSDQQRQDASQDNPAPAPKLQPKPPIERETDRPEQIEPNETAHPATNAGGASLPSSGRAADRSAETSHKTSNAPSTATMVSAAPEPAPSPAPVRDLSLRLTSATNEQVDIKVQDKGGQLSVAVHSNSPELSADLRQQVGDLVTKLDRAGIHTEIEKPGGPALSAQSSGQSSEGQGQEFSGQNQQQRDDQREPNREEPKQQGSGRASSGRQPEWLHTMNGILSTGEREGATNR